TRRAWAAWRAWRGGSDRQAGSSRRAGRNWPARRRRCDDRDRRCLSGAHRGPRSRPADDPRDHHQRRDVPDPDSEMRRPMKMSCNPQMAVMPLRPKTAAGATSGYRMVARGADRAEIYLYGIVGADWFGEGVTAKQFAADLKGLGNTI